MKHLSQTVIERNFTKLTENHKFIMLEHNEYGEDWIIVVNKENNTYCNTQDSFNHTIFYPEEYTWFNIRK